MAQVSDIAVYQKLTEVADELDQMAAEGATLVGEAALLTTAAKTMGSRHGERGLQAHHGRPATSRLDS